MKVSVIGAGSFGTAIGILLCNKGYEVSIWDRDEAIRLELCQKRQNTKYLPGVMIPDRLIISDTIENTLIASATIVLAVPSHAIRNVCENIKDKLNPNQIIVTVAKGIENNSLKRMSEVIEEFFPNNKIVILSGPSHAEEVAKNIPTALVSASKSIAAAEYIQDLFMTPNFRVYTNSDLVGVEIGGAVKNIIALAAGISDGLGFGDNTKAALMTRGITEISRLGVALGANKETFLGLAGIGDLIVTCTSMHSRNRRAGILIGKGKTPEEASLEVQMVVEGIKTTKSTYELAKKLNIHMPITEKLYDVLFNNHSPLEAVSQLMERDKKDETQN